MKILFISLLVLLTFPVAGLAESSSRLEKDLGRYITNIKNNIKEKTLENGLKVIVYERPEQPVFTAFVTVNVGGANEEAGATGIAHLLEHMAFKGTKTLGTKDFEAERRLMAEKELIYLDSNAGNNLSKEQEDRLEEIKLELEDLRVPEESIDKLYSQLGGVGLNATTSADSTNYFVSLPLNAFEAWCQIESDRHLEPVWRDFYEERDVVLEERRMRYVDNVDGNFYQYLISKSFKSHPYRRPVIGYVEDLKQLTMTKVDEFYKKHYGAENFTISIVGGLDAEYAFKQINKYFAKLPRGTRNIKLENKEIERTKTERANMTYPASPRMALVVNKPNYPDPDAYALELWLEAKLGGITSPIYKNLILENNVATSLEYFEAPGVAVDNIMVIMAQPASGVSLAELEKKLLAELQGEITSGLRQERLRVIKLNEIAKFVYQLDSNSDLARGLSYAQAIFSDWRYFFNWYDQLKSFSNQDLNQVAQKYLNINRMLIIHQEKGPKKILKERGASE